MRLKLALSLIALASPVGTSPAWAGQGVQCADFQRHADGSWTPRGNVTLDLPNGHVELPPDRVFTIGGAPLMGVDFAAMLEQYCAPKPR